MSAGPRRLLIVASSRWGYLWQRHQALAVAAADDGWQVDFLQPRPRNLRQIASFPVRMLRRTRVEQEHAVAHPGVSVIGRRGWTGSTGPYDLALVYLPDVLTEALLHRLRPERVVLDAVLDWAIVPPEWFPPIGWRSSERRVARRANAAVTTDAPGMAQLLERRGMSATVVPPAADDAFLSAVRPEWAQRSSRALYFGAVRPEVDVSVLERLARAGIGVDVVGMIGDDAVRERLAAAGIVVQPPVTVERIAEIASTYRIVLLPYRGARSATIAPAKLFNAVATGAWVVTAGIDITLVEAPGIVGLRAQDDAAEVVRSLLPAAPERAAGLPTWAARWQQLLTVAGLDAHSGAGQ